MFVMLFEKFTFKSNLFIFVIKAKDKKVSKNSIKQLWHIQLKSLKKYEFIGKQRAFQLSLELL